MTILVWILFGSLSLNIVWILREKEMLDDFYLWKKTKNSNIQNKHYAKGLVLGILLGPATFVLYKIMRKNGKVRIQNQIHDN